MASLRRLKKDIDFLVEEVISDCCTFMYLYPDKKREEAIQIIQDAVELRNRLYAKVNHPQDNPKKLYYKAINRELLEGVDASFEKISGLTQ
ncbi:MAG: hypothetical protein FWE30_02455 [Bacteroidales bacterium]|nr:hypothetical protein [Bacteroidales bacterium]MCL2738287.1 hypothetical protein [Bacteroidales bacterium]